MHVCLVCVELFGFGTFGGFGRATRIIGRELTKRDIKVTVIVPRRSSEYPDEFSVDGMRVLQFQPSSPWSSLDLYRSCQADIYHSQDASFGTYLAMKARPNHPHLITFRDPMNRQDWKVESQHTGPDKLGWLQYRLYVDNALVTATVKRAQGLYCAAEFLIPKVMDKYHLKRAPLFLPTPVSIPDKVSKAERPTVCFVGRWHRRKRPERFFELSREFPAVDFIAVGGTRDEKRDRYLRSVYSSIPNLEMTGVIDQFRSERLNQILEKSWVIVNTAAREGLPNTFLEAAAYKCAILSYVDPDRFASSFGYYAKEGELRKGLESLLENDRWKSCGERGYQYVRNVFATDKAIDTHIEAYRNVLSSVI